jgi:hypothetical protein
MAKKDMSALDDDVVVVVEQAQTEQSMHDDMHTLEVKSKLVDRMSGSRAEIVMMSVRMKKSERRRLKEICSQLEISAQDLVFESVNMYCKSRGVRGLV